MVFLVRWLLRVVYGLLFDGDGDLFVVDCCLLLLVVCFGCLLFVALLRCCR